jgi:hypothetical protein
VVADRPRPNKGFIERLNAVKCSGSRQRSNGIRTGIAFNQPEKCEQTWFWVPTHQPQEMRAHTDIPTHTRIHTHIQYHIIIIIIINNNSSIACPVSSHGKTFHHIRPWSHLPSLLPSLPPWTNRTRTIALGSLNGTVEYGKRRGGGSAFNVQAINIVTWLQHHHPNAELSNRSIPPKGTCIDGSIARRYSTWTV